MDVFRLKGYAGASITELTTAMGINRFSLYDTFTDKHGLYMSALDRYERCAIDPLIERLDAIDSIDALDAFFDALARHVTDADAQPCCLMHRTACADAAGDDAVRDKVVAMRTRIVDAYRALIQRLRAAGHAAPDLDPDHAAWTLFTLQSGIISLATAPPPPETITASVRTVLATLTHESPAPSA